MSVLPSTPEGWAIQLSKLLNITSGENYFPVNVPDLAREYSRSAFSDEPIVEVQGVSLSTQIEGMLVPVPGKGWGIIYNNATTSTGRQNFTLAHEFGHYLFHRHLKPDGFQCGHKDMHARDLQSLETEANRFASLLLMPPKDFRAQVNGQKPSLELMRHLAERYHVSITAALLQWIELTEHRAMVVAGVDGFIDWSRSSSPLFKSGIFYKSKQVTTELPARCLASQSGTTLDTIFNIQHGGGIWLGTEPVEEHVMFYQGNRTISLLLYPKYAAPRFGDNDEETEPDSFDYISNRTR